MNILILGGFLGSGKTTALLQLAKYLVARGDGRANGVVILENEIGEVGVDDEYLRGGGLTVNNLFSGCGCCSVAGELTVAARRIQTELKPDWLIVETTGVAYPKNMQENLIHALRIRARVVVLCDAKRWTRIFRAMRQLIEGQIAGADAVLVNKSDLVPPEDLQKIECDIRLFESGASIHCISAISEIPDDTWRSVLGV
jgi:G3E family GTPase